MKKKFEFKINGNEYSTEIISVEDNVAEIEVNGTSYTVELTDRIKPTPKTPKLVRSQPLEAPKPVEKSSTGVTSLKSPLPGVILEFFVKVGDTVKEGDNILLLEAMKMENNIQAECAGKIISIEHSKGDSVMEGDVLVTIE